MSHKLKLEDFAGEVFTSVSSGNLKIIAYETSAQVTVEFLLTGSIKVATLSSIRKGAVYDPYYPAVLGVGFSGLGVYANKSHPKLYDTWRNMLARCYCPITQAHNPTYIGTTVCTEWHNFQNFAEWYTENHTEGAHLDKDIRVKGNGVYSPTTCMFVPQHVNNIEAAAKHWEILSPEGVLHKVYNMSKFAKENGLTAPCLYAMFKGRAAHHKQWRAVC